ncbi:MAG: hypothetical protein AAF961_19645, partial [Planctomycetota bacterium]
WSMSAAGRTITSTTATFSMGEFTIGPTLLPVKWAFVAEMNFGGGSAPETIISIQGPESVFGSSRTGSAPFADYTYLDDPRPNSPFAWAPGVTTSSSLAPGVWTAVPEPSAFHYVGVLAALASCGVRWKRRLIQGEPSTPG